MKHQVQSKYLHEMQTGQKLYPEQCRTQLRIAPALQWIALNILFPLMAGAVLAYLVYAAAQLFF
jgi:hypothetical protein